MKKTYLAILTSGLVAVCSAAWVQAEVGGLDPDKADVVIMPNFAGLADETTSLVVNLDATASTCDRRTYKILEDFVDVSCGTDDFCANDASVGCADYEDCLSDCVGLDNTQPLTTGYCDNGFGSRVFSQPCSDIDTSNCTERLNNGSCRDSGENCQVSANDPVDGTNPLCHGSETDTCLTGDPACILDNDNQFLATGFCGDANGANVDFTAPCNVGGSDCDAGTYCIPAADDNYMQDATCVTADGIDTLQTCYSNSDCRGTLMYDYDNPIIEPLTCTYDWTAPDGTIVGGSTPDTQVVQYSTPGTYQVTLTMSVDDVVSGQTISASRTTEVMAIEIAAPVSLDATFLATYNSATCQPGMCINGDRPGQGCLTAADCCNASTPGCGGTCVTTEATCSAGPFAGETCISDANCTDTYGPDPAVYSCTASGGATVSIGACNGGPSVGLGCDEDADCPGAEATLNIDAISSSAPGGLARAYIYWGDRRRDVINNPEVGDTLSHTYVRDRATGYNARVKIIDYSRNKKDITVPVTP